MIFIPEITNLDAGDTAEIRRSVANAPAFRVANEGDGGFGVETGGLVVTGTASVSTINLGDIVSAVLDGDTLAVT